VTPEELADYEPRTTSGAALKERIQAVIGE
jgi:hypothetical protein